MKDYYDRQEQIQRLSIVNRDHFLRTMTVMKDITREEKENLNNIIMTSKHEGDNAGQWGYYISSSNTVTIIDEVMTKRKLRTIIDLGSGPGHILMLLWALGYEVKGIEIEQLLIDMASYYVNVKYGDILKPIPNLDTYDAIYFYEPLGDEKLAKKFVDNLVECTKKGQIIFYNPAGTIQTHLRESNKFRRLKSKSSLLIYKRK